MVCAAIRPHVQVPIDVHLMDEPVDELAVQFAKAGADIITFHPDASPPVHRTLSLIRDHGCKAGLVFNPAPPRADKHATPSSRDRVRPDVETTVVAVYSKKT